MSPGYQVEAAQQARARGRGGGLGLTLRAVRCHAGRVIFDERADPTWDNAEDGNWEGDAEGR